MHNDKPNSPMRSQDGLVQLARSSVEIAEVAVRNLLNLSSSNILQLDEADWAENLAKVKALRLEISKKLKQDFGIVRSSDSCKVTDDEIYKFMITFFTENDQLPTVAATAKQFGIAKNAIQQRFAKFEKYGKLVRNTLENYMFPRG